MVAKGGSLVITTNAQTPPPFPLKELKRTVEIIKALRSSLPSRIAISIDTRRAETARQAVLAGADIVNDVSAGRFDADMMSTVGSLRVPYVMMHSRGTPETMGGMATYGNVVEEVCGELAASSRIAREDHEIYRWRQVLDVGIGFAKTHEHNIALLRAGGSELSSRLGDVPIMWGASRKGFIGNILGGDTKPWERDYGTVGAHLAGVGVEGPDGQILRVHNVKGASDASRVFDEVRR
jgi:dihydropteroate synthase